MVKSSEVLYTAGQCLMAECHQAPPDTRT